MSWPSQISALSAADVVHRRLTTMPADTTVGALRAYFRESDSRRLAVLTDGERYVGTIEADALPADADDDAPAGAYAKRGTTLDPRAPAEQARELGLRAPSRRVPVVDGDDRLIGVVAITRQLDGFCGAG